MLKFVKQYFIFMYEVWWKSSPSKYFPYNSRQVPNQASIGVEKKTVFRFCAKVANNRCRLRGKSVLVQYTFTTASKFRSFPSNTFTQSSKKFKIIKAIDCGRNSWERLPYNCKKQSNYLNTRSSAFPLWWLDFSVYVITVNPVSSSVMML